MPKSVLHSCHFTQPASPPTLSGHHIAYPAPLPTPLGHHFAYPAPRQPPRDTQLLTLCTASLKYLAASSMAPPKRGPMVSRPAHKQTSKDRPRSSSHVNSNYCRDIHNTLRVTGEASVCKAPQQQRTDSVPRVAHDTCPLMRPPTKLEEQNPIADFVLIPSQSAMRLMRVKANEFPTKHLQHPCTLGTRQDITPLLA